jgi:hypothetical protein
VTTGQLAPDGRAASPHSPLVEVAGEVDPAVMAALVAAVDAVWLRPKRPVAPDLDRVRAWRFSGRWWSRPATSRRVRPRI